jgi:hypothetical protein
MHRVLILLVTLLTLSWACQPIRLFDETPEITFVSIEPEVVTELVDSITITLKFTDGDGDLGLPESDTSNDITVLDKREGPPNFGDIEYPFRMPFVTPPGNSKQISGEIRLIIQNTLRRPGLLTDTLKYSIQIRDRANRVSNIVESPKIVVVGAQ